MDLKYAPYKKESAKSEGEGLHVLEVQDLGAWKRHLLAMEKVRFASPPNPKFLVFHFFLISRFYEITIT